MIVNPMLPATYDFEHEFQTLTTHQQIGSLHYHFYWNKHDDDDYDDDGIINKLKSSTIATIRPT